MRVTLCFLCGELRGAEGRAEVSWCSGYATGRVGRRAEFVWLFQDDWGFGGGVAEAGWAESATSWMGISSEEEVKLEWWN